MEVVVVPLDFLSREEVAAVAVAVEHNSSTIQLANTGVPVVQSMEAEASWGQRQGIGQRPALKRPALQQSKKILVHSAVDDFELLSN